MSDDAVVEWRRMDWATHLGPAFEDAVGYALAAHGDQKRKGTAIPYAAHCLAVSALVLEAGGSEVQAIAALLHDTAEDCGGQPRLDDIRRHFDAEVADIVEACSDSLTEDPAQKLSWDERKQAYLDGLVSESAEVLLVSLADKLHNATAILRDLRSPVGIAVFDRFKVGPKTTIGYYTRLVDVFDAQSSKLGDGGLALLKELRITVAAIGKESGITAA